MKTYTEIIKDLYHLNLRKNERWGYTFSFTEGNYKIDLHDHSTGCSLRIDMVSPDGDSLRIYYRDTWYSSRYEFNNEGKKLGFQHNGPWEAQVHQMMLKFDLEIEAEKVKQIELKNLRLQQETQREKDKVDKFAKLVTV